MRSIILFTAVFIALAYKGWPAAYGQDHEEVYYYLKGTINNKYPVAMFIRYDLAKGSDAVFGNYFYESSGTYLVLTGYREQEKIVLHESVEDGGEKTGVFSGTFSGGKYSGTWNNTDNTRQFVFDLQESEPPAATFAFGGSQSKDDGKYACTIDLQMMSGTINMLTLDVTSSYGYSPHICSLSSEEFRFVKRTSYGELYQDDDPDCRIHIIDTGNCLWIRFHKPCRMLCGANAYFEDIVIYKAKSKMKFLGLPR